MKIGILSMQRILNYGSYFQAYSLKTILESLGHTVQFVDYQVNWTINVLNSYKHRSFRRLRLLKRCVLHPHDYHAKEALERYAVFAPCYPALGLSAKYHFRSKVDVLIIGSDEVFNCLQSNQDVGYSLQLFGKQNRARKLVSYAASFGDTTLERLKQYEVDREIADCLRKFDMISVRDKNSVDIVTALGLPEPLQHFDPVLIGDLEKRTWGSCNLKNFMIVYGYHKRFTPDEGKAIMDFAKERHLRVILLNEPQTFGDELIYCKPDEILSYFACSDYVVTDTFHGTIFAVLYHKPVAVFCRTVKDTSYSNENKLWDLVAKLELKRQCVSDPRDLGHVLQNAIDFDTVDRIRARERERAITYLIQACGGKNGNQTDLQTGAM